MVTVTHTARAEALLQPLRRRIQDFEDLLKKQDRVLGVVEAEAREVAQRFGRDRRTLLTADSGARPMA
jgi:DNA gyrase/topoisomerase IV subunit A